MHGPCFHVFLLWLQGMAPMKQKRPVSTHLASRHQFQQVLQKMGLILVPIPVLLFHQQPHALSHLPHCHLWPTREYQYAWVVWLSGWLWSIGIVLFVSISAWDWEIASWLVALALRGWGNGQLYVSKGTHVMKRNIPKFIGYSGNEHKVLPLKWTEPCLDNGILLA